MTLERSTDTGARIPRAAGDGAPDPRGPGSRSRRPRTRPARSRSRRRAWLRRVLIAGVSLLLMVLVAGAVVFAVSPSVADAQARVRRLAAADGATHVTAAVPPRFAESIVASEDAQFYSDLGVDPVGVARAGWATLTHSGTDPGGSTLSQQLAKILYTGGRVGIADELEQVALAVKLNLRYTKAQILRMYAATVYFGNGFYGLYDASCGYFGVAPARLSLAQTSTLAGLVQAPSAYDPLQHFALAKSRQRYVLDRLVATGKITSAQAARVAAEPLQLVRPGSAAGRCAS